VVLIAPERIPGTIGRETATAAPIT
jgi:hypothetical protein